MRVEVNGEKLCPRGDTLAELLVDCGFDPAAVATAVNGEFIPRIERTQLRLEEGDRIEVLAPMQGG